MLRKGLLVTAVAALIAALAGRKDIMRFIKIKRLSAGSDGRPELVPASGSTAYPQPHATAGTDGTG